MHNKLFSRARGTGVAADNAQRSRVTDILHLWNHQSSLLDCPIV